MRIAFAIARILLLPVLWLVSSSALAQATAEAPASTTGAVGARLQYTRDDAASRCPEPRALQDAVSSQLGYPVFEREPITHHVSIQIAAQKRGLRAQIEVRKSDGTPLGSRAIESPSSTCEELVLSARARDRHRARPDSLARAASSSTQAEHRRVPGADGVPGAAGDRHGEPIHSAACSTGSG